MGAISAATNAGGKSASSTGSGSGESTSRTRPPHSQSAPHSQNGHCDIRCPSLRWYVTWWSPHATASACSVRGTAHLYTLRMREKSGPNRFTPSHTCWRSLGVSCMPHNVVGGWNRGTDRHRRFNKSARSCTVSSSLDTSSTNGMASRLSALSCSCCSPHTRTSAGSSLSRLTTSVSGPLPLRLMNARDADGSVTCARQTKGSNV